MGGDDLISGGRGDGGRDWSRSFTPKWRQAVLALPVLAAAAHATKPLLRWLLAEVAGMEFGSLSAGPLYPLFTHLVFGFVGGLLATMAWRYWQRMAKHGSSRRL